MRNIVLIMADQLAPHFTSAYGHPIVATPHLDALADRCARFDAAYCHPPLCAPAWFTMLADRSVSAIGAWDNASGFPAATPTLAHFLGRCGVRNHQEWAEAGPLMRFPRSDVGENQHVAEAV